MTEQSGVGRSNEPTRKDVEPTTSTTERLRELLDERGVEHYDGCESTLWGYEQTSESTGAYRYSADEISGGFVNVWLYHLTPEQAVEATLGARITGDTSDGYHTFNELYHHRAVLFSVIIRDHRELAWKSKLHHDGTMYDGMFIVGIETPNGQTTYHYDVDPYWDMFDCRELERAPEWDGHTPSEAIERITTLGRGTCYLISAPQYGEGCQECSACGEVLDGYLFSWGHCPSCGAKVVDE